MTGPRLSPAIAPPGHGAAAAHWGRPQGTDQVTFPPQLPPRLAALPARTTAKSLETHSLSLTTHTLFLSLFEIHTHTHANRWRLAYTHTLQAPSLNKKIFLLAPASPAVQTLNMSGNLTKLFKSASE